MPIVSSHPVTFPVGNSGSDNIAAALALVKIAGVAIRNNYDTSAREVCDSLGVLLDLAERFLVAGSEWARDTENAVIEADHVAALKRRRAARS